MPVNYQQVKAQIQSLGADAVQQRQALIDRLAQAEALLVQHANDLERLQDIVDRAVLALPSLRCALPEVEGLTFHAPLPYLSEPVIVLAADGSQIQPSRHGSVDFGLVNVGVFRIAQGEAPTELVRSRLLFGNVLFGPSGRLGEDLIALMRDVNERTVLAELAKQETLPVITLTDGGLEIFREPREDAIYREQFDQYLDALQEMAGLGTATAAYVDRPRADLVVRLLELAMTAPEDWRQAAQTRPLGGVTDAHLFSSLVGAGERSAVFAIQSISAREFTGDISLSFFYLNVAQPGHPPYLARVEVPAWVAHAPLLLNRVHAVLYAQSQMFGARPYPYALHRAHEIAVVRMEERSQVEAMINAELLAQGLPVLPVSNKQSGKDLPGRTRVEP